MGLVAKAMVTREVWLVARAARLVAVGWGGLVAREQGGIARCGPDEAIVTFPRKQEAEGRSCVPVLTAASACWHQCILWASPLPAAAATRATPSRKRVYHQ